MLRAASGLRAAVCRRAAPRPDSRGAPAAGGAPGPAARITVGDAVWVMPRSRKGLSSALSICSSFPRCRSTGAAHVVLPDPDRRGGGLNSAATPEADASWRKVLAPYMAPSLRSSLLNLATSVVPYLALLTAMCVRDARLRPARARARDPGFRVPRADVHRLPRLRARLLPPLEARERDARRGTRCPALVPLPVVALQARRPPRDRRRPRPTGGGGRRDADDRRVPRAALVGAAWLPAVPQPVRDVRARAALGGTARPAAREPVCTTPDPAQRARHRPRARARLSPGSGGCSAGRRSC